MYWARSSRGNSDMIAALFVQKNGCYYDLNGVDPWDIDRDARNYCGPNPVVAHPPCQRWGNLAFVNYKRWGGDHNRPGNDSGCFASALLSVNRFGGVLEHPAHSRPFASYGIAKPRKNNWYRSGIGWVCEVWQSAYGHRANKATWLYYVGDNKPFDLIWDRPRGSHQIGHPDNRGKNKNKPTLSSYEANATPILFRDVLVDLATHSRE